MLPFLREDWGNPSSLYYFGNKLAKPLDEARERVATLLGSDPKEIIFTSCGTESNNTAIRSALRTQPAKRHIITSAVEHSAVLNVCQDLENQGYRITYLPVDAQGRLDAIELQRALQPDTALVSLMLANNETGVLFPVSELADICRHRSVPIHTDAVQVPGKLSLNAKQLGVDFLSLSAHKLHAPKGVGLLYARRKTPFYPLLVGGHQERDRRGGTENVAGMVAFGCAAELALNRLSEENTRVRALRDRLESRILETIPRTQLNGATEPRLPNTSNLRFDGIESEALLLMLDQVGICASSGSACTTGSLEPSHVLSAMGLKPPEARSSIRFSLSVDNTDEDVEFLLQHLPAMVDKLRAFSPASLCANT
jgi:cysteine desulfurase